MSEREQLEKMQSVLLRGIELVESTLAHVSHGGPTREDAEKWVMQAKDVLTPQHQLAKEKGERTR